MNHYGFWLLLDEESEDQCSQLIYDVQVKYLGKPPFLPHVSVFSSQYVSLETAQTAIQQATANITPFSIQVEDIAYESNDWSRTLYLKLSEYPFLTQISNRLSEFFDEEYDLFPHLSIAYDEEMTTSEKNTVISTLNIPDEVQISSLAVINPQSDVDDWRNYTAWKVESREEFAVR